MADKTKKSKAKALVKKKKVTPKSSIFLYIIGIIVAIVGIIPLVDYLMIFVNHFSTYLASGYPYDTVFNSLVPSLIIQLCSYVATYLGIAVLLFGAGIINTKVFRVLNSKNSNVNLNKEVATTLENEKTEK